jgi:hypothetical protein
MSSRKRAGLMAVTAFVCCAGPVLGQAPAADVGPPPSGPPVPVVPGAAPPDASVAPPLIARPGPPPGPAAAPPSGPFGSGFVHEPPPPLPPPLPLPPPGDWMAAPPPGWFVGLEADIVQPSLRIHGDGGPDARTDLDWTLAPRILIGYRFEHAGSVELSYRYLESQTSFDSPDGSTSADLHVQEDWVDIAYVTRPLGCGNFRFQAEAGLRTAYLHNGGTVATDTEIDDGRENFWGAGPEVGLRLTWAFGDTGLALFGNSSVGVLFGRTTNRVDTVTQTDPNSPPVFSSCSWGASQTVVDWRGEAGLSWAPRRWPWWRLDVGVRGEVFGWDHVTYSDVGPFLRCLLAF